MASIPPPDPYAQEAKRSNLALGIGIGVLGTLILIGGGVSALGLMSKDRGQSAISKSAAPNSPALPATGGPIEPITPKPPGVQMPDDIYAWLEHLRITEERRKQISTDQMGDLLVTLTQMQSGGAIMDALGSIFGDDPDNAPVDIPEQKVNRVRDSAEQKREQWRELEAFFRSVPPPAECAGIQASFAQCLGETGSMMMEVLDSVATAEDDPQAAIGALTRMRGQSTTRIDALGRQTDEQVQAICDKYQTRKWFRIESDYGGGVLGKIQGF